MNSKAQAQLTQVRAELAALENFTAGGVNNAAGDRDQVTVTAVTGEVITKFDQAAIMAVDTASLAASSGVVALRAIAAALALAPAAMADKDFAAQLATLSTLRARDESRQVSMTSFAQYVSLIRRCEKLAFDFSNFKGGINALQVALRDRANEKQALEKGQDIQTFLESKKAARADKKATREAALPVVVAAKEAEKIAKAEVEEVKAEVEEVKAEAEAAKAEVEEVKAEAEAAKAEAEAAKAEAAKAEAEAADTIARLTAERDALAAEVARLQALLAKRSSKKVPA